MKLIYEIEFKSETFCKDQQKAIDYIETVFHNNGLAQAKRREDLEEKDVNESVASTHLYFVSFEFRGSDDQATFGNQVITLSREIDSDEMISSISRHIFNCLGDEIKPNTSLIILFIMKL